MGKYTHILQESSFSVLESTQTGDTAGEGLEEQWGTVSQGEELNTRTKEQKKLIIKNMNKTKAQMSEREDR